DLLDRVVEKAADILEEKASELPEKQTVAKQVGIGAVVFQTLINNRIKDIDFWWDRALNFDGETGPYVQYTHVRCLSVLKKSGEAVQKDIDGALLAEETALDVLMHLSGYDAALKAVTERNEPYILTRFVLELAQKFNAFYYGSRVLTDDPALRAARLALTDITRQTLAHGMALLGMDAPEKM
ncbi:MAG: arginine--tRNA ligase, partial [Clostridia bacterium]|nr:arginine--tRNA ligase [Clostridia bacterium]